MAGIFGKSKELESQLEAMRQELTLVRAKCTAEQEDLRKRMVQGLTNIHLYGQLAAEEAETSEMKAHLQAILMECERMLQALE